jgi:F-type H+-transporting ATPase subunit b
MSGRTKMRILIIASVFLLAAAVAVASEGQQNAAEQGVFSGTFADSLWTIIAFVLLLVVLGKFAWKPLLDGLKARQEHIQHEIRGAEAAKQQAEKLLDEYKQKGLQIIEQATKGAQRSQREIIEETQQETTLIRQRARDDIQHALTYASEHLWDQASEMIQAVGTEVLGRAVTAEDNQRLIHEAIEKIRASRVGTEK